MTESAEPRSILRHRFLILLGMLVVLLLIAPILVLEGLPEGIASMTMGGVLIGVLLSSVVAVSTQRRQVVLVVSLVVTAVAAQVVALAVRFPEVEAVRHATGIITLVYVLSLLARHIFTSTKVTVDTIAASLCVYLLIGVLWSMIYSLIEVAMPGSFRFAYAGDQGRTVDMGGQTSIFALYLSFTTLSTLGYGDIVPVTNPARMFAVTEAIVGQVYLAVLVARLVGMHIAESVKR